MATERNVVVKFLVDSENFDRGLSHIKSGLNAIPKVAAAAGAAIGVAAGGMLALAKNSMTAVDAQAKIAQSLGTTTVAMQNLTRAGELAGLSMEQVGQVGKDLTRRLSQAQAGMTDLRGEMGRLNLSVEDLLKLPLDQRVAKITAALNDFVPEAERAAVAGKLFGEEASLFALRLSPAVIAQATAEVRKFNVAINEADAAAIQEANDALSAISLVMTGIGNQVASQLAPSLTLAANRFTELASAGGPVGEAIDKVVEAFGALAETITSEGFMTAATATFTGLVDLARMGAEGMVWAAENTETLTYALGGLAIAVAALGGPITWVVGLTGAAVAGFSMMSSNGDKAASALDGIADAAMGVKKDGDQAAASVEGVNVKFAVLTGGKSAVVSANQEIAGSFTGVGAEADVAAEKVQGVIDKWRLAGQIGIPGFTASSTAELEAYLNNAPPGGGAPAGPRPGMTTGTPLYEQGMYGSPLGLDLGLPEDSDTSGGGGGETLAEKLQARLETLQDGLATEAEMIDEWYQEGLTTLQEALDSKMITEEEYRSERERLEREHQDRIMGIQEAGAQGGIQIALGAAETILSSIGTFNSKAFKMAKVAAATQAFISTLTGQAKALELPFPMNLAAAAKVFASGMGIVSAIKGTSEGGGGSSGRSGSSGGVASPGGSGGSTAPTKTAYFNIKGDVLTQPSGEELIKQINEAQKQGYYVNMQWEGA